MPDRDTETLAEVLAAHQPTKWAATTAEWLNDLHCTCGVVLAKGDAEPFDAPWRTHVAEALAASIEQARAEETDDGQANDCTHMSATGIDTTSPRDPAKVWRCDHCGLRWRSDGQPVARAGETALREAAANAVRRLHRCTTLEGVAAACWEGDCEHPECYNGGESPVREFKVCKHCADLAEESGLMEESWPAWIMWPCATAVAVGFADQATLRAALDTTGGTR